MKAQDLQFIIGAEEIVSRALHARSVADVDELAGQITEDVGAKYERPVGDRADMAFPCQAHSLCSAAC